MLHQPSLEPEGLDGYLTRWVVTGRNMPQMSVGLTKLIRLSLFELFTNIFDHADSSVGGLAIGQLYPVKRQFQICVCDGGLGLVRRVQQAGFCRDSAPAAIRWALEDHSTRLGKPAGMGLRTLRNFIHANGGCCEERKGQLCSREMTAQFPGTLLEMRLNVLDNATYRLYSE
jgi:hypothetical protein